MGGTLPQFLGWKEKMFRNHHLVTYVDLSFWDMVWSVWDAVNGQTRMYDMIYLNVVANAIRIPRKGTINFHSVKHPDAKPTDLPWNHPQVKSRSKFDRFGVKKHFLCGTYMLAHLNKP